MSTRTIERIDSEIETARTKFEVISTILNQERILVESLSACKNEQERQAVVNIGPSFIDQYYTLLEKFTHCACADDVGFQKKVLFTILQSVGIRTKGYYIPDDEEDVLSHLVSRPSSQSNSWCCYRRHELIRVYCLIKNNPSIIERVREQLKQ